MKRNFIEQSGLYANQKFKAPFYINNYSNNGDKNNIKISRIKKTVDKALIPNSQYFPETHFVNENESVQSSATTRMKNIQQRSKIKGYRPKLSTKSVSISEKSTKKQLFNEISKLTSQLQFKNSALINKNGSHKVKQTQVLQLYRVANFYQGKIKYLQSQIKRYQQALQKIGKQYDSKTRNQTEIQQMAKIFEQMRKQNSQLAGRMQQKDYQIGKLQQKSHRLQLKINFLQSKQSYMKQSNKQTNSMAGRTQSISQFSKMGSIINLKNKQQNYGNIQSKINKIESSINFLKKQNQSLQVQLSAKQLRIYQLQLQLIKAKDRPKNNFDMGVQNYKRQEIESQSNDKQMLKKDLSNLSLTFNKNSLHYNYKQLSSKQSGKMNQYQSRVNLKDLRNEFDQAVKFNSQNIKNKQIKQDPLNKVTVLTKSYEKQLEETSKDQGQNQQNRLVQKFRQSANLKILRKLKYQLLTQEVTHQDLIKTLVNQDLECQELQQDKYNLSVQQAEQLFQWVSNIKQECQNEQKEPFEVLKAVIPYYQSLTIRKQSNLKSQIANEALNRFKQFQKQTNQIGEASVQRVENYFKQWGLGQSHLDVLLKCYYQQTQQVNNIDFKIVRQIINRWQQD